MNLYIGVFIGFIMGTFAGIILAALMVAAREESKRMLSDSEVSARKKYRRSQYDKN